MEQLLETKFLPELSNFINKQIGYLYYCYSSEYINDLVNCMKNSDLILEMEISNTKIYSYKSHPEISVLVHSGHTIMPLRLTLSDLHSLYSTDNNICIKYNCAGCPKSE